MFSLKITFVNLARVVFFREPNYRSEMTNCSHHSREICTFRYNSVLKLYSITSNKCTEIGFLLFQGLIQVSLKYIIYY